MTHREIKLLFLLGIVVVLVVGLNYLILPTMKSIDTLKLDREELVGNWEDVELNITNLNTFKDVKNGLVEDINTSLDSVSEPMSSSAFDTWLFAKLDGLTYRVWDMNFTERAPLIPYVNIPPQKDPLPLNELIQAINDYGTVIPELPTTTTELWYNTAAYSLNCTYATFVEIINRLQDIEGTIFLSGAEYGTEEAYGYLFFEIYSLDRIAVETGD